MKTKNFKLSLLVLTGLVILSYGFLISAQEGFNSTSNVLTNTTNNADQTSNNLTKQVAQKLSTIATNSDPASQQISLETLQKNINESVSETFSESDLPKISPDSIKIKKQDYKGTSEQIKAKKKEDVVNYMIAIYYILSSNSPKPITSNSDVLATFNSLIFDVVSSIGTRQSAALDHIQKSGEKMLAQMQDIEVPEELIDLHIKGLKFAQYAMSIKSTISPNTDDALLDLSNLAKLEGFVEAISSFFGEAQNKFTEYGIDYDDLMMQKINNLGAPAPDPEDLEKAAAQIQASTSTSDTTSDSTSTDSADTSAYDSSDTSDSTSGDTTSTTTDDTSTSPTTN
ncbi:MAG: hypothetical protein WCX17_04310 [Parcubacteria group bacterium]|jgi:hypothetical protein